ncbi:MAG: cysteine hydrolase [Acholeplasmataceae bacterium]|nr:MAG: cysteine hydrolase [Acholeplasmataceae bacterium]
MKRALIVVDYQKDFVDGALGFPKAPTLAKGIRTKIGQYRNRQDAVLFTFDTHDDDYLKTREGRHLPVPHCIKGTPGFELDEAIKDVRKDTDHVFYKPCFGSLALADHLKEAQYDHIELVGLVTNICVLANAVIAQAALPEADIIVDAGLCASFDETLHDKALDIMRGLFITVKEEAQP